MKHELDASSAQFWPWIDSLIHDDLTVEAISRALFPAKAGGSSRTCIRPTLTLVSSSFSSSSSSSSSGGVIENKHSTDVEYPPPPSRVRMCLHPAGIGLFVIRPRFECLFSLTLMRGVVMLAQRSGAIAHA